MENTAPSRQQNRSRTLLHIFRHLAETRPDRIAFTFLSDGENSEQQVSYQELYEKAISVAAILIDRRAINTCVMLCYPSSIDYVAAFLGCMFARALAVPVYPPRSLSHQNRLISIMEDCKASMILTTDAIVKKIRKIFPDGHLLKETPYLTTDGTEMDTSKNIDISKISESETAFLQYTSGSTSKPKGIMVSHANIVANERMIQRAFSANESSICVSWLPLHHDMGLIGNILQAIYSNFHLIFFSPTSFLQKPVRWLNTVTRFRATHTGGPNFAYDLCVEKITDEQKESLDLDSLVVAYNGSEPVRKQTLDNFYNSFSRCGFKKSAFSPCYGLAETTLIVSGHFADNPREYEYLSVDSTELSKNKLKLSGDHGNGNLSTIVSCGRFDFKEQKIAIVNPETFMFCPKDQIGEIWISGPHITKGYWQKHDENKTIYNAYSSDKVGPFLRTGDLGVIKNGQLFVTGRLKDIIIIHGVNYYPQDIEYIAEKCSPELKKHGSAAFVIESGSKRKLILVAEIGRKYSKKFNTKDVGDRIFGEINKEFYLALNEIVFVKAFSVPKTTSGKIQRHRCRQNLLDNSLHVVAKWIKDRCSQAAPDLKKMNPPRKSVNQSKIIEQITKALSTRLEMPPEQINYSTPFHEYGLDSIALIELATEIESRLGISFSPSEFYDYPNIKALSDFLTDLENRKPCFQEPVKINDYGDDPIAIVGIANRFPGANSPEAFWDLLVHGKNSIANVPEERWSKKHYYSLDQSAPGKMNTDFGSFIDNVFEFDNTFFNISPNEAKQMDPQQRVLLELAWETFERSGEASKLPEGSNTGVFIGASSFDYAYMALKNKKSISYQTVLGSAHSILANRLSYCFNLSGPSICVDTACSSSLVAVHLAVQSLKNSECDMALAGGINLILSPETSIGLSKGNFLSPTGNCKTFDCQADGYVRGEGCGLILLKRLSDAKRENNTILATIRGSCVNQDGKSNGFTAPNSLAQEKLLWRTLQKAGLKPEDVSFIEAHGTGTVLGDSIETNALKRVFNRGNRASKCYLGAVKANIGHLEAAAGIAGLIKSVLCLHHKLIPPQVHLTSISPHITLDNTRLEIPLEQKKMDNSSPCYASVSSFGFGGTNACILLENIASVRSPAVQPHQTRSYYPFCISAKSQEALKQQIFNLRKHIDSQIPIDIANISYSLNCGRADFKYRFTAIADSHDELKDALKSYRISSNVGTRPHQTVFLFPDASFSHLLYKRLGKRLYKKYFTFKKWVDLADDMLDFPLSRHIQNFRDRNKNDRIIYSPVVSFVVQFALAKLLHHFNVTASSAAGYGSGSFSAASYCGYIGYESALKIYRKRIPSTHDAVKDTAGLKILSEDKQLREKLSNIFSNIRFLPTNYSNHILLSNHKKETPELLNYLDSNNIRYVKLNSSEMFVSLLNHSLATDIGTHFSMHEPKDHPIPMAVQINGKPTLQDHKIDSSLWTGHFKNQLNLEDFIEHTSKSARSIFLEMGLNSSGNPDKKQSLNLGSKTEIISLIDHHNEDKQFTNALRRLYQLGININWDAFYSTKDLLLKKIVLPTYVFERKTFRIDTSIQLTQEETRTMNPNDTDSVRRDSVLNDIVGVLQKQSELQITQVSLLNKLTNQTFRPLVAPLPCEPDSHQSDKPGQYFHSDKISTAAIKNDFINLISRIGGFPKNAIDVTETLETLGFDSIMLTELFTQLQSLLPTNGQPCQYAPSDVASMPLNDIIQLITGENCDEDCDVINSSDSLAPPSGAITSLHGNACKVDHFPEYQQLKKQLDMIKNTITINPYFKTRSDLRDHTEIINGQELINFSSYNYLGLSGHPEVNKETCEAINKYGTSVSASRVLSGEITLHRILEKQIAQFIGTEDSLVFVSGHATNVTTLSHIAKEGDLILYDALSHNSLIQGCLLSKARRAAFPHNDWQALERLLQKRRSYYNNVFILLEGVYSMDGDLPELPKFIEIKNRHRAYLYIDEAHSIGVMGKSGRGITEYYGCNPQDVDFLMGTLSKSLASCGGYIASSRKWIEYLKYTVPGFIYSAGISPANTAAAIASLKLIEENPSFIDELHKKSTLFLELAKEKNLNTGNSCETPIIPIITGSSMTSIRLVEDFFNKGINVDAIVYPAVKENESRLRFFISQRHTESQIEQVVETVAQAITQQKTACI